MGTKVNLDKVNFKELSEKINLLNDSGLLSKKMGKVGKTKERLVEEFVAAVNSIPDDKETGEWTGPLEVAEYYNTITETVQEEKPKPEKVEKPPKEKKAPKEKKEKPAKEAGKSSVGKYGFREESALGVAAKMLSEGKEHDAVVKHLVETMKFEKKNAEGRVAIAARAVKKVDGK